MNKFEDFFYNVPKKHLIDKWKHYFPIYEKHFNKFVGKNPVILEIGTYEGGSIDMFNYYFDNKCTIYSIDINPYSIILEKDYDKNVKIVIGDQGDPSFWDNFLKENDIYFDIIVDDGGHRMHEQIITMEKLYYRVNNGGVYLCEDTHTSYWESYGGGYLKQNTFIEYSKGFIDLLHAYYFTDKSEDNLRFRKNTFCVSFYDSVVAFDKKIDNEEPIAIQMI